MLGIKREMRVCQNTVITEKSPNSNYGYYSRFCPQRDGSFKDTFFSSCHQRDGILLRTNCSVYNGGRIDYKNWLIFA